MAQLKQRVVIVTGAGTGVGRAVVNAFVREGAQVALVGRRQSLLNETAANLPPGQTLICPCDVTDRSAVDDMVDTVSSRFGAMDILVNNAGVNVSPRTVAEIDPADWDRIVAINLTGAFNVLRAVLPTMRSQQKGLIVNISSIAGLRGSKVSGAAYSASKHGIVALSQALNEEEAAYNIRSCAICPGEIDTPMLDQRPTPTPADHRARILQPQDIADAVLFVAAYPPRVCIPLLVIKPTVQIFR